MSLRIEDRKLVGHEFDLRKLDHVEGVEVVLVPRHVAETAVDDLQRLKEQGLLTPTLADLSSALRRR